MKRTRVMLRLQRLGTWARMRMVAMPTNSQGCFGKARGKAVQVHSQVRAWLEEIPVEAVATFQS